MKVSALRSVVPALMMLGGSSFAGNPEGIQSFSFRDCEVICIQDTATRMPRSLFTDSDAGGRRQQREESYESSVNVFLIRRDGRKMLVDAGNDPSRGSLHGKLLQAGVRPEEVTDIFITHIHPDHVGGLIWNGAPLFPNAAIHIAKEELDAWRVDERRKGLAKYLAPYEAKIHSFGYGEKLPGGLSPEKRAGHTPGHTIFRMQLDDGEEGIFVGDIVHAAELQFPFPTYCARFDMVPAEAVESRIRTLRMQALLFGAHIPFPGIARGGIVAKDAPDWSFVCRRVTPDGKLP